MTHRFGRLRGRAKNRRGATLVVFALLIVPLLTLAAFAIDMSQWQVGTNQLQTVADASALAAARAAQLYRSVAGSSTDPNGSFAYATNAASANTVFGSTPTVAYADVQPMFYTPPSAGTESYATRTWTSTDYNAIRVTVRATATRTLSGVVRGSGPVVTRSATAWIANINSGTCITPWGLPYTALWNAAVAAAPGSGTAWTGPVSTTSAPPDLNPAQLAALSSSANLAARTVVLSYSTTPVFPAPAPLAGYYQGYGYDGNNGHYQNSFWQCDNTVVAVGGSGAKAVASASADCPTMWGLAGSTSNSCQTNGANAYQWLSLTGPNAPTCYRKAPTTNGLNGTNKVTTYDATCYADAATTIAGKRLRVTWSDLVSTGAQALKYREIGMLQLACAFGGASGSPGAGGQGTTNETCTVGATTVQNQAMGTIVVVVQGITSEAINSGTVLGNTPGEIQRLVLVK